jgi:hypothetical protein
LQLILRYYAERDIPEEVVYQTIICNSPELKVKSNNFRYENWSEQRASPKWLDITDIPSALRFGAHFARKFRENSPALDLIEQDILGLTTKP